MSLPKGSSLTSILLVFLSFSYAWGMKEDYSSDSTSVDRNTSFFAFPVVFYTPETEWGFGGASLLTFNTEPGNPDQKPSQLGLGGAYTLREQLLSYLPFELFLDGNEYWIHGEIGYYDYFYEFYGIGNRSSRDLEFYEVTYPRVRLNALKAMGDNMYLGIRYIFDDYRIDRTKDGGLLDKGDIRGSDGGTISGSGVAFRLDTRDRIYSPTDGWFLRTFLLRATSLLGSDFDHTKFELDLRKYVSFKGGHIVAINGVLEATFGDPPFNELATIGGPKRMRGYYKGRYMDAHSWMIQAEYRKKLFWRLGVVAFGGVAQVTDAVGNLGKGPVHPSYGAGVRGAIDKERHLNLRADIGFGETGEPEFYLTYKEAF